MAIFKCDIKQKFGKFSGYAWKAGDAQGPAACENEATAGAAVDKVLAKLRGNGFGSGDEVIFRDTAYADLGELKGVMARAPY